MYCTKIPCCFPFYNDDTTIKKGTCNTVVATVFLSLKRTKNNKLHCILQSTITQLSSLQSHIMTKVSSSKNRGTEKVIFVQGRPCVSPSTACVHPVQVDALMKYHTKYSLNGETHGKKTLEACSPVSLDIQKCSCDYFTLTTMVNHFFLIIECLF